VGGGSLTELEPVADSEDDDENVVYAKVGTSTVLLDVDRARFYRSPRKGEREVLYLEGTIIKSNNPKCTKGEHIEVGVQVNDDGTTSFFNSDIARCGSDGIPYGSFFKKHEVKISTSIR
jgi:hypothetical protein